MTAEAFAHHAHRDQKRRYTDEPFIVHPADVVARMLLYVPDATKSMIEAAWLHDVLEDTDTTEEQLRSLFSDETVDLVVQLTKRSKPEDGNRATRKEIDRLYLATVSDEAKMIKCSDIFDNVLSILTHDPEFAVVYLPECRKLVDTIHVDHPIWEYTHRYVNFVCRLLGL